jgi:thioredoxin reductase
MRRTEVVIVGGGPAGLSAALVLGRCRRDVLLYDGGRYRNAEAAEVRGFLTRDGTPPAELRELAHAELRRYQWHPRQPVRRTSTPSTTSLMRSPA